MGNKNLSNARKNRKDEFYTLYQDIADEVVHYHPHLKDKVVYCNADGSNSNFVKYFIDHFDEIGLKKLVATQYGDTKGYYLTYDGKEVFEGEMVGDGDFRSFECVSYLIDADIIITNPPFSLFREYIDLLVEYNKQFIILGNYNAVTYKNIFPLFMNNELRLGYNTNVTMKFSIPSHYEARETDEIVDNIRLVNVPSISWFTNLPVNNREEMIELTNVYNPNDYPSYDNYDAIEVNRVANIPKDYYGIMGVPITFLTRYNPKQFKILGTQRWSKSEELMDVYRGDVIPPENDRKTTINGRETYDRIFIKRI